MKRKVNEYKTFTNKLKTKIRRENYGRCRKRTK